MNNKTIDFRVEGLMPGEHERRKVTAKALSTLGVNSDGNPEASPLGTVTETFTLLPSILPAITTNLVMFVDGTNAPNPTRSAKGGVVLTTAGADQDQSNLAPYEPGSTAYNALRAALATSTDLTFETRVSIATITTLVASVGLSEVVDEPYPDVAIGDAAVFLFDPDQDITTGLLPAQHANWILAHKVNAVDTFTATDIQVNAGQDYDFKIIVNDDLTASYYINGVLKGASPVLTSGDSVSAFAGIEANAAAVRTMDVRYIKMGKNWI